MNKYFMDLEIPYGLHPNGYLVRAEVAEKYTEYLCPECEDVLVLRAGEYRVKHFSHKANTACSGESIIHKTAKMLIEQAVMESVNSSIKRVISLQCECAACKSITVKHLPHGTFTSANQEKSVGNFVCDVVAQKEGVDVLAIEIFFTHSVDANKAKNLSLPWLELSAESVLSNPYYWQPIAYKLKDVICEKCKEHMKKLREVLKRWSFGSYPAAKYNDTSKGEYLAEIETCFRCKQDIPVFWWSGVPFCESAPPEPKPKSVKFTYSQAYGGSYWTNTCANCNATQGDNFLFIGFSGKKPIFKDLPIRETREMHNAKISATKSFTDFMIRNLYKS